VYQVAYEKQKKQSVGVVSVQAKLLKTQAIAVYRRLLTLFPEYPEGDKVMFFMGHEMRELADYDNMLETYQQLADKYPKSQYRLEALLVMGDHFFDNGRLDLAEKHYTQVLQSPESRVHAMARYKMAWCKINRGDFKEAASLFEGAIQAARKWFARGSTKSGAGNEIDLRREALVDLVFCYTEVYKPKGALQYFKSRADSRTTYLAALHKLGNRYHIKQDWKAAAMVYREILSLAGDVADAVEYADRLFESLKGGELYNKGAQDVAVLTEVLRRRYFNAALTENKRIELYERFEKYIRFIATKMQDLANEKKSQKLYEQAAEAYETYLSFFGNHKKAPLMRANLAETYYSAKRYLRAAENYLLAAKGQKGAERENSIYTAVVSSFEALKAPEKLSRLDTVQARAGLRKAGFMYIREFPNSKNVKEVKFNIARTFYDAGDFEEAIRFFIAFVEEFLTSKEAIVAAHLVLDSYRSLEDYEGLITIGKDFEKMQELGDSQFRKEIAAIIEGGEQHLLRTETIKAEEEEGSDHLEKIAAKYRGTSLGEKALVNAFLTARNSKDPEKIFEVGEKLLQSYPKAEQLSDVLSTMGKISLNSLQFSRGAAYLEAAASRQKENKAAELYKVACQIRTHLGDRTKAEQDFNILLRLPYSSREKANLAVELANLHIQANDWDSLIGLLHSIEGAGISSPGVFYLLGYALFRQDQLASAQGYLLKAVDTGKNGSDSDRESAAAAQFYLAEISFKAFEGLQLSSDLSELGPTLQQKLGFMARTRALYTDVGNFGSAVWTVAALGRLASVDEKGAKALRELVLPGGLSEDEIKQVKDALENNAEPLAKESKQAIKQCADIAKKFKVLSEASKICLEGQAPSDDPQAKMLVPSINRTTPEGAPAIQQKLAYKPDHLPSIEKLGLLYLVSGDPYMARMILEKGLETRETEDILNLVGVANAHLGQFQDAYELFERILKRNARHSLARANKVTLLYKFGYRDAARAEAKKIRNRSAIDEKHPGLLPDAFHALGWGR
ncbi:MAG: tetratricopeptide repeat protein, partial [Pseudomonadota bacterium]